MKNNNHFLFIDEEENDIICTKKTILTVIKSNDKKEDKKIYLDFMGKIDRSINIYKDKGEDFQIKADFDYIYDDTKINKLKESF